MSFNPEDFGMDGTFRHWQGDNAEDHLGPFFYRQSAGGVETAMRIGPQHCNSFGITHGGILMAFADYTLCLAAMAGDTSGCLTVSCNNEFVGASRVGELLSGYGELTGGGKKLKFSRAQIYAGDTLILNASATVKLPPRPA